MLSQCHSNRFNISRLNNIIDVEVKITFIIKQYCSKIIDFFPFAFREQHLYDRNFLRKGAFFERSPLDTKYIQLVDKNISIHKNLFIHYIENAFIKKSLFLIYHKYV